MKRFLEAAILYLAILPLGAGDIVAQDRTEPRPDNALQSGSSEESSQELARLQGVWRIVGAPGCTDEARVRETYCKQRVWVKDDTYSMRNLDGTEIASMLRVRPAPGLPPGHLDFILGNQMKYGMYEFEEPPGRPSARRDDQDRYRRLRIAFVSDRPKTFPDKSKRGWMTLERTEEPFPVVADAFKGSPSSWELWKLLDAGDGLTVNTSHYVYMARTCLIDCVTLSCGCKTFEFEAADGLPQGKYRARIFAPRTSRRGGEYRARNSIHMELTEDLLLAAKADGRAVRAYYLPKEAPDENDKHQQMATMPRDLPQATWIQQLSELGELVALLEVMTDTD